MRLRRAAGAVLFPHECVACGREGKLLCAECESRISAPLRGVFSCPGCGVATPFGTVCGACRPDSPLAGAVAAAPYAHPAWRELLHAYKYENVAEAGAGLARLFGAFLRRHEAAVASFAADATVVPVPLHWWREARRGFNQAEVFARVLARRLDLPVARDWLERRFRWRRQADIRAADQRTVNASGSVRYRGPTDLAGRRLVLIDDVLTTGATLKECARVLKAAGAGEIWAVTLLRG